jgi:hypothetical protein
VLIEPEAVALYGMTATEHGHALGSARLLDTTVGELRARLRERLGLGPPVIVTGHQAEFCHAGVLAKTIAVDALAARVGGTGVFLTVDTDVPKATRLAVPCVEQGQVRREFVPIPRCDPKLPTEWQPVASVAQWREFFDRVTEMTEGSANTLLASYAGGLLAARGELLDTCDALERGQASAERVLGIELELRLRVSRLSKTPEFRAFAAHLFLDAGRFAEEYNRARRAYRQRHPQRNRRRPVPALATADGRVELPLWLSRAGEPRRRLYVGRSGDQVELFADGEAIGTERVSGLRRAENHSRGFVFEEDGWQLRPRGLGLAAFARLLLGDVFVHGIGGAKYDEMTEDFVREFFGVELPPAVCVTATAYLPLPWHGVSHGALATARHARRDLRFNPQRHLLNLPPNLLARREQLIRASARLRASRRLEQPERRWVFDQIRAANQELLQYDAEAVMALERRWRLLEDQHQSDVTARDREYFFGLHPRRTIEDLMSRIRSAMGAGTVDNKQPATNG